MAQIIYIAGPLHASLNYAQYPLGAYMPSVAATIYKPAPTSDTRVDDRTYLEWFPRSTSRSIRSLSSIC